MIKTTIINFCTLVTLFVVCGCSATIVRNAAETPAQLRSVAILPLVTETDMARERTEALERSVATEFAAKGYRIIPAVVVRKYCDSHECAKNFASGGAAGIPKALSADAVAQLVIKNTRNANLILARYTSISGSLSLFNDQGRVITSVTDSQSERGGLLLKTGQLLEGIKSSVDGVDSTPYNRVSMRFTRGLVQQIHLPQGSLTLGSESLKLSNAKIESLGDSSYRICVEGTQASSVSVQIERRQVPLREVLPGKYCSVILLNDPTTSIASMLESRFGTSVSSPAMASALAKHPACVPDKAVIFEPARTFKLAGDQCKDVKFIIYQASTPVGPFTPLSGFGTARSFTAPLAAPAYAIIAISREHGASLPVVIKAEPSANLSTVK